MKIYKPKFTDKRTGAARECRYYYLSFTDNQRIKRRLSLGTENKRVAERIAEGVRQLLDSGGVLKPALRDWFNKLPQGIRDKLIDFGLVDDTQQRSLANLKKPLSEHLDAFYAELLAKGNGRRYAGQVAATVKKIFDKCGFRVYGDIDANVVYTTLADLRGEKGIGQRTFNYNLKAVKQFCRWMLKDRRATDNPVAYLDCIQQTEIRHKRRALTLDEQRRLLAVTAAGPAHHNLTGYERSLIYTLAIQSGLRANEIRSLTVGAFDFTANTVTVPAAYTKNKETACIDLKPETAAQLKAYFAGRLPTTRAFNMPDQPSKMIQKDLEAAGIPYETPDGFADFHSLRHTLGSMLAAGGCHPKVAQSIMRHKDIGLTMNIYTHTLTGQEKQAIDSLPDLRTAKQKRLSCA
jgi:integrase